MLNMFSVMIVAPLLLGLAFGTALLFLTARLWKVPGVTWRRSFALYLVLSVISIPGVLASRAVASLESTATVMLLMLFFLCGQWLVVVKGLHTTYLRGLAVFLSVLAVSSAASVPAAYGIRRFYEAFTVPTGGMAPALIGRHGDQVCSNCGYAFPVSLSDWSKTSFGRQERQELLTCCSNCREPQTIGTKTRILSGDCFIVDKTAKATRWSLAAFRKPPERHETYLRRLVGLPGETVELIHGEVFIDGKLERKEPHVATDLWMPVHELFARRQ